jgi:outer membrane protein assembly factor BamB
VIDELIEKGIPPTGTSNLGGSIVTAGGLVFIGATNDSRFRAFDKATGKEIWTVRLPASAHATPMTFLGKKSGKQFVVIASEGETNTTDPSQIRLLLTRCPRCCSGGRAPSLQPQTTCGDANELRRLPFGFGGARWISRSGQVHAVPS